jgi:hypothetical protein
MLYIMGLLLIKIEYNILEHYDLDVVRLLGGLYGGVWR